MAGIARCKRFAGSLGVLVLALVACTGIPEGLAPVRGFEPDRYLGKWYEIARLDHSFERGLTAVTATYGRRDDGGIRVVNRGYDAAAGEWSEAVGKAYFTETTDVGRLKVSFFGPFYGGYNVIALDKQDYRWSMVAGPDRGYLWVLARTPSLPTTTVTRLVERARAWGFPVEELIFPAPAD